MRCTQTYLCSLFPIPCSLFPVPYSLESKILCPKLYLVCYK
ncbi:hypothetical protein [Moorena sp. SIO4G3]|nr:hypothetical protein [Moorena sp. SIO4G3]